jgi:hypothetical protein
MPERNDCNDDLAYQTLDYIREHPEEWNQEVYFCGTTACFAGRAIILEAQNRGLESRRELYDWRAGGYQGSGRLAAKLLGWTDAEAYSVFHDYTQDFDVLEHLVKRVLNGEVT